MNFVISQLIIVLDEKCNVYHVWVTFFIISARWGLMSITTAGNGENVPQTGMGKVAAFIIMTIIIIIIICIINIIIIMIIFIIIIIIIRGCS